MFRIPLLDKYKGEKAFYVIKKIRERGTLRKKDERENLMYKVGR